MKKQFLSVFIMAALLVGGCSVISHDSSQSNNNTSSSQGGRSSSGSSQGGSSGGTPVTGTTTIDIFSSNDVHGQIYQQGERAGILKFMSFFKEMGEKPNTLLLDQGDTWQGSIYSNSTRGALYTDLYNYVKFDARSVGNHDFDWGADYIAQNSLRTYNGYSTPTLAGNVYNYDFENKIVGTEQQSQIGRKSVIYTLENGVKVGILGGIGQDQITSICTNNVQDVVFTDHIQFIKDEATHLRNDEHCDIVICSIHTGQESVMGNNLGDYVDLVLCGHTHREETAAEGSLRYVQSLGYTGSFGYTTLTYDYATKKVTKTKVNFLSAYDIVSYVDTIDAGVQQIFNSYKNSIDASTNPSQVLANNVVGYFYSSEQAANLMCKAIYDTATSAGYNVCLSYVNYARQSLPYGSSWTYEDIYTSFPFDNIIYIADIKGSELLYEVRGYNYIYRNPSFTSNVIDPNGTYKIAVIDYLYTHANSERYYDYFSVTGGTSTTTLPNNYREILRSWLISEGYNSGKELNSSDYSSSLWQHDRTVFTTV